MMAKKAEERRRKMIWQNAMYDASMQQGHLRINNTKLETIDPMAFDFHSNFGFHMVSLRLVGVELIEVPPEIGTKLLNLEVLSLANNQIMRLPDSFSNLTNLKELYLMYNHLVELPERIGNINGLEKIGLTNNRLASLPVTFGHFSAIEKMDLECNMLTILPENLHEMSLCNSLNLNNNKLIRLPRCLGRMPSLTHLSCSNNQITYLPLELFSSKTLKVIRVNVNKIETIPEHIGDVTTLRELSIDYNDIKRLPLSFYKLVKLKILRIEGNALLLDPPADVIVKGGAYVVHYCRDRFMTDKTSRMRQIILTTQALLLQIAQREIADAAQFETNILLNDTDLDTWTAVSVSYLFNELLPNLRQIWITERDHDLTAILDANRKKYTKEKTWSQKDWITEYSFSEREVLWAYSNFSDVVGPVLRKQQVNFTKCCCVDPVTGKRKPCIPPKVGYMCRRESVLLKSYLVRQRDKEERDWQAYKAHGINDAIVRAEAESKAYLESQEGSLWLENVAYEQAEEMLLEQGANRIIVERKGEVEAKKNKVMARFDKKKQRVIKSRDEKMKVIEIELDRYKADRKVVKEGYMRNAIEQKINELTHKMANLPEHQELALLQEECERECQIVEDNLFDNDSDDSMNTSEAEASDPYSTDDSSPECQHYQYRLKRYMEKRDEEKKFKELKERYKKEKGPAKGKVAIASNMAMKFLLEPVDRAIDGVFKVVHKANKKVHKELRHIREVSKMRTRKILHKLNGNFDEIQRELKYEIFHQYVTHQVGLAREKARHEFSVIDTVRHNMQGKGTENAFKAWVKWVYTKKQRIRRDIRRKWKTTTKAFDASMLSVSSAQAQVDMWCKGYDIYSDRPFWQHSLTNDLTYDKPGIQHYLPANFHIPEPPEDLPPGIPIDTSSDESDSNWQRRREAERAVRAETKRLQAIQDKKDAAARAAAVQQYDISSDSSSSEEQKQEGGEIDERSQVNSLRSSRQKSSRSGRRKKKKDSLESGILSNTSTVSSKPSLLMDVELTPSQMIAADKPQPKVEDNDDGSLVSQLDKVSLQSAGMIKRRAGHYDVPTNPILEDDNDIFRSQGRPDRRFEEAVNNPPIGENAGYGGEVAATDEVDPNENNQLVPFAPNEEGSIATSVTDDQSQFNIYGNDSRPVTTTQQTSKQKKIIRSMSIDTSSASIYTQEYMDVLCNTAPNELVNFKELTNENDEEYKALMEGEGSLSGASQRLIDAVHKARHYMATSEYYKNRKNITLPDTEMSNLSEVFSIVDKSASNEYELAYKAIRKKRNQLNPVRHHLYMAQMNRKPKSFEMIKAEQAKAIEDENKAHMIELMDGVFVDDRETEKYIAASDEELLRLAGGTKEMILKTGKQGTELKSILAQRALHVRRKLKQRAIDQKLLPPKPSFYKREVMPFFTGDYHGSSSDDEEDEEEERRQRAERKEKRRLERAEKAKIKQKLVEKAVPQEEEKAVKGSRFAKSDIPDEV